MVRHARPRHGQQRPGRLHRRRLRKRADRRDLRPAFPRPRRRPPVLLRAGDGRADADRRRHHVRHRHHGAARRGKRRADRLVDDRLHALLHAHARPWQHDHLHPPAAGTVPESARLGHHRLDRRRSRARHRRMVRVIEHLLDRRRIEHRARRLQLHASPHAASRQGQAHRHRFAPHGGRAQTAEKSAVSGVRHLLDADLHSARLLLRANLRLSRRGGIQTSRIAR